MLLPEVAVSSANTPELELGVCQLTKTPSPPRQVGGGGRMKPACPDKGLASSSPARKCEPRENRRVQRQKLEADFARLAKACVESVTKLVSPASDAVVGEKCEIKSDDEQSKGPKVEYCKGDAGGLVIASTFNIQTELVGLVREMSDAYKKYPLLCKRGTSAEDEAADDSKNYKNTKKRKKHRPKKHQIKSAMKMKRKKKCSGEDAGDLKQHLNDSECHRCVAVAYNKSTRRIGYGMSGLF
mmetsp:Transcript_40082/g.67140  ORF Transcript_40082/g.67140 Transcript_40082/m.67140 type:complete len:241 (+) Transcript_40082:15-737(+)